MSGDISMTMLVEALLKANSPSKASGSYCPSSPSRQHHRHHRQRTYYYDEIEALPNEDDSRVASIHHNPFGTIHTRPTSASSNVSFSHGGEGYFAPFNSSVPFPTGEHSNGASQSEIFSSSSPGTTTESDAVEQSSFPDTFYSAERHEDEEDEDMPSACQWTASSRSMTFATTPDSPFWAGHPYGSPCLEAELHDEHEARGSCHLWDHEPRRPMQPLGSRRTSDIGSTHDLGVSGSPQRSQRIATPPGSNTPRKSSLPIFRRQLNVDDASSDIRQSISSSRSRVKSIASSIRDGDGTFRWGFRPVNAPEKVTLAKKLWRRLKAMSNSSPSMTDLD
ncbi:hypothetical protein FRB96_000584 [Tulasnella sp. 330]|nr:hypothetical protein FRB96_000584 [Tulasnella sp. 330]